MAVLRSVIGIKDTEMAEILACSVPTIHSVECGRLKLSNDLARRVAHKTGVSLAWLLAGKVKAPPVAPNLRPYTRELYERHRARKDRDLTLKFDPLEMAHLYSRLRAVLASAGSRSDFPLAAYKVERAIKALADEFGYDESVYTAGERTRDLTRSAKLLRDNAASVKASVRGLAKAFSNLPANLDPKSGFQPTEEFVEQYTKQVARTLKPVTRPCDTPVKPLRETARAF